MYSKVRPDSLKRKLTFSSLRCTKKKKKKEARNLKREKFIYIYYIYIHTSLYIFLTLRLLRDFLDAFLHQHT